MKDVAKGHYQEGAALYQQGDYGAAWLEFNSAYQLVPKPALLFNMARCEVRLGRTQEALRHFREYLQAVPNDPDAPGIREEAAELQAQLDRDELGRPSQQEVVSSTASAGSAQPGRRPWPVYGTIAAAGTVILGIASIATLASAGSRYGYLQSTCAPSCSPDDVGNLQNLATGGYVLLGLTTAAAVTTAVVLTLELRGRLGRRQIAGGTAVGWRF